MDHETYKTRPISAQDVPILSTVMTEAEGYQGTNALSVALQASNETALSYIKHPKRFGHVVEIRGTSHVVGFLLAEVRNRRTDTFEDHSIIDELAIELFPPSGDFCEIFDLWVSADHRRKGLATQLKVHLERYLRMRHCSAIYTHTEINNLHALRINRNLGYREVRTGPIWDRVERVSFIKHLHGPCPSEFR